MTQVCHQQLLDKSGEEVPGAHHILDIQTTYTYTNGKISKLVQEFDAAKVEASRKLAKKVAEIIGGAPRVETPPLAPFTKQAGSVACSSSQSVGSSKAQANLAKC